MNLIYTDCMSKEKPNLIDSSLNTVFIHKDIIEKKVLDKNGVENTVYTYKEATLSKNKYEKYLLELSSENIIKEIEELKQSSTLLENNNVDVMEHIASLETVIDELISTIIPEIMGEAE